jgi:hypothetical protein
MYIRINYSLLAYALFLSRYKTLRFIERSFLNVNQKAFPVSCSKSLLLYLEIQLRVAAVVEGALEAVGKRPSAALPSSLVTAAYVYVRLVPRNFGSLAYGHFPPASQKPVFRLSLRDWALYLIEKMS